MSGMEVELDQDAPTESWRAVAADWAACCRETWLCEELALFRVSREWSFSAGGANEADRVRSGRRTVGAAW